MVFKAVRGVDGAKVDVAEWCGREVDGRDGGKVDVAEWCGREVDGGDGGMPGGARRRWWHSGRWNGL